MFSLYIFLVLIVFIIYGFIEYKNHQKNIYSIPVRIHINGTRGKSSVTRLVGAGLRESGIKTITKVTGTFPRLILDDGTETEVYRKSGANIIEQLSIVRYAAKCKAQALVMECMALQPQYQWVTEHKMIHATIGVMTNIRMDHVDVMGYTLEEIAKTLSKTVPKNSVLFTAENIVTNILEKVAKKRNTKLYVTNADDISDSEIQKFNYIEHKENVALALAICKYAGVNRETALKGMYKATPDAGVLMRYRINDGGKNISFYSAFAANDPDSSFMIWEMIKKEIPENATKIVLLNTRSDRLDRAKQLVEMIETKLNNNIDYLILMGQSTDYVQGIALKNGVNSKKIVNIGWCESKQVYDKVIKLTNDKSIVFAIGNMGGMGAKTVDWFESKQNKSDNITTLTN
jgi:poly-gamma-glutamate synthase PgsB/CapB